MNHFRNLATLFVACTFTVTGAWGANPKDAATMYWSQQQQITKNAVRAAAEEDRLYQKAANACLALTSFPTAPGAGEAMATFSGAYFDTAFSATLWRFMCNTDPVVSALFLRITPTSGNPFICSPDFVVVQGGAQYDIKIVQSFGGSSFCGNLYVPTTFFVDTWLSDLSFNRSAQITLIYEGYPANSQATLSAYAAGPTPITPAVGLWWNPSESGSGYNIDVKHGVLVLTVYSYKANGDSEWYIATGPLTNNGHDLAGVLDKARHGQCISCTYKAPSVAGNDGPVTIHFTSSTSGTMTLPGGRSIPIQPQVF